MMPADPEPQAPEPDVLTEVRDEVGWIRINRPEQINALRRQTLLELSEAVQVLGEDGRVRAIVLTGEGRHFAAGADLAFLEALSEAPASVVKTAVYDTAQAAVRRLYQCSKPTVAAIHGAAVTVGCELALACDFRLATPTARFQESWIKLGVIPPLGGLFLLPHMVGLGRAAQMCLRGEAVGAEEALSIGLAHELVQPEDLQARAAALARELADLPPLAYASAKEGLHRAMESSMANEWAANVSAQGVLFGTADFKEGLKAFREKRRPMFIGA